MMFLTSLRWLLSCLCVCLFAWAWCEAKPEEKIPKAPDPIKAVPIATFKDMGRTNVIVSPDGKTIRTSKKGTMWTWDLPSGKLIQKEENELFYDSLTPSPDGKWWLRHPTSDTDLSLVDPINCKVIRTIEHSGGARALRFTLDGKYLVGWKSNKIRCWQVATGKVDATKLLDRIPDRLQGCMLSPTGTHVAAWTDETLIMLDFKTGRELWRSKQIIMAPGQLVFAQDESLLGVSRLDGNEICWLSVQQGDVVRVLKWEYPPREIPLEVGRDPIPSGIDRMKLSGDGRVLFVATTDQYCVAVEMATNTIRYRFLTPCKGSWVIPIQDKSGLITGSSAAFAPLYVWDATNPDQQSFRCTQEELKQTAKELENPNGIVAFRAMQKLASHPEETVLILTNLLRPVEPLDRDELQRLLAKLESDDFQEREKAELRLLAIGQTAKETLRLAETKSQDADLRMRLRKIREGCDDLQNPTRLQVIRGVELLEWIRSDRAVRLLQQLKGGAAGAWLTEESQRSIERFNR